MFGKIIGAAFLFIFNCVIFLLMDMGFHLLSGETLVPQGYEWLYVVASVITVKYQFDSSAKKEAAKHRAGKDCGF
mgnify:CR=1 FL=1